MEAVRKKTKQELEQDRILFCLAAGMLLFRPGNRNASDCFETAENFLIEAKRRGIEVTIE